MAEQQRQTVASAPAEPSPEELELASKQAASLREAEQNIEDLRNQLQIAQAKAGLKEAEHAELCAKLSAAQGQAEEQEAFRAVAHS